MIHFEGIGEEIQTIYRNMVIHTFDYKEFNEKLAYQKLVKILEKHKFVIYEIHQSSQNLNGTFCVEKSCFILKNINLKSIFLFSKQNEFSTIYLGSNIFGIPKTLNDKNAETEVKSFYEKYKNQIEKNETIKETIRPIVGFLIRRFFYPSYYFKDPSFFLFKPNIVPNDFNTFQTQLLKEIDHENNKENSWENFDEKDFIKLRQLYYKNAVFYYLVVHIKTMHIFMMKKKLNGYENKEWDHEIEFCKSFYHRSIVHFYGFVYKNHSVEGLIYDFMCNGTLTEYINKNKNISNLFSFSTIIRLIDGIDYIHSISFIHRDIKPSNILLDNNFSCYINDFDQCKKYDDNAKMTEDFGTLLYASPEQYQGYEATHKKISYPTDIYSFGQLVYFLFAHKNMLQNSRDINEYIMKNEIPEIPNLSKDIYDLCKWCVKYDPDQRPAINEIKNIIFKNAQSLFYLDQFFSQNKIEKINKEETIQFIYENLYFISIFIDKEQFMDKLNFLSKLIESIYEGEISQILFNIGYIYSQNEILPHDYNKAMKYFLMSVEINNNCNALDGIGSLYLMGYGVPKNITKACEYYELSAQQNNPKSIYMLGCIYYIGLGVTKDEMKAKSYFESAANLNYSQAFISLGDFYFNRHDEYQDKAKGIEYYKKAEECKDDNIFLALGTLYRDGKGFEQNSKKAIKYLKLAIKKNKSAACYNLAEIYYKGIGINKDFKKARKYYEKATKGNYAPYALFILGKMYADGDGVDINYQKTLEYYEQSAKLNNSDALNGLGVLYFNGFGIKQNYSIAREYFEQSKTVNNNSYAYNNLADIYLNGYGVPKDYYKAQFYYLESAKQKNIDSFFGLGNMYYKGYIIQDFDTAIKYYKMAAKYNHSEAMFKIGKIYFNEKYKLHSFKKALKYFEKSSVFNNPNSFYLLGLMHLKGLGVKINHFKSFKYFMNSADLNYFKAFFYVGILYERGLGVERNLSKALEYYFKCEQETNYTYIIHFKGGTKKIEKKNYCYRYRSANKIGLIFLLENEKKNNKLAEKYLQIAAFNEYPIGQNNYGLYCLYFSNKKQRIQQMFEKASKQCFDLIEFNIGRYYEINCDMIKACEHYKRALMYENNFLFFRNKIIDDESLEMARIFINCFLYLRFSINKSNPYKLSNYLIIRAIFRPILKALFISNYDSYQFTVKNHNNNSNLKDFFLKFPIFNFNKQNQSGWKMIKKSENIKTIEILIENDDSSLSNIKYKRKAPESEDLNSLFEVNYHIKQKVIDIFNELNKTCKTRFQIINETEIEQNSSLYELKFISNDNITRCLKFPVCFDHKIFNYVDLLNDEINKVVEEMGKILFSEPLSILFGRFPEHIYHDKYPKRKDINFLFYEGLGL